MQYQTPLNRPDVLGQLRRIGYGFLAGLIVGVLIGWFFHGVVALFVRFGLLLILLIPLILIGLFLWRSRRSSGGGGGNQERQGGMRVYTWSNDDRRESSFDADPRGPGTPTFRRAESPPEPERKNQRSEEEIIDLEFEELKRDVDGEKSP